MLWRHYGRIWQGVCCQDWNHGCWAKPMFCCQLHSFVSCWAPACWEIMQVTLYVMSHTMASYMCSITMCTTSPWRLQDITIQWQPKLPSIKWIMISNEIMSSKTSTPPTNLQNTIFGCHGSIMVTMEMGPIRYFPHRTLTSLKSSFLPWRSMEYVGHKNVFGYHGNRCHGKHNLAIFQAYWSQNAPSHQILWGSACKHQRKHETDIRSVYR